MKKVIIDSEHKLAVKIRDTPVKIVLPKGKPMKKEWIDAGKPPYTGVHAWRKMSGVPNRGITPKQLEELLEAIK